RVAAGGVGRPRHSPPGSPPCIVWQRYRRHDYSPGGRSRVLGEAGQAPVPRPGRAAPPEGGGSHPETGRAGHGGSVGAAGPLRRGQSRGGGDRPDHQRRLLANPGQGDRSGLPPTGSGGGGDAAAGDDPRSTASRDRGQDSLLSPVYRYEGEWIVNPDQLHFAASHEWV